MPRLSRPPALSLARRAAVFVAWGILGFVVIYLVLVNSALAFGGVSWFVNRQIPKDLRVEVGTGYSFWPGLVHVRDFYMEFQDKNVQFAVGIDKATVDLNLWQLAKQRLHATKVRAQGTSFRFRHKVQDVYGIEKRLAGYPPMQHFPFLPLRDIGPEEPPIPDDQYKLWHIQLDDVDASVKELWFMEFRYLGQARATGGLDLRPARTLSVKAARLELYPTDAVVKRAGETLLSHFEGEIRCDVPPYDVREPKGMEVLRKIESSLALQLTVPSLQIVEDYMGPDAFLIQKGRARVDINISVRRGVIEPGAKLSLDASDVIINTKASRLRADVHAVALASPPHEGKAPAEVRVDVPKLSVFALGDKGIGADEEVAQVKDIAVQAHSSSADLLAPWQLMVAKVKVPELTVLDARFLNGLLFQRSDDDEGEKPRVLSGRGRATLELDVSPNKFTMNATANFEDAALRIGELVVQGAGNATVDAGGSPTRQAKGSFSDAEANFSGVSMRLGNTNLTTGYWMHVKTDKVSFRGMPPKNIEATVHVRAKDGSPLRALMAREGGIPAAVTKLLQLPEPQAQGIVQLTQGGIDVELQRATSGALDAQGYYRSRRGQSSGAILLRVGAVGVGIRVRNGDISVNPLVGEDWLRGIRSSGNFANGKATLESTSL